MNVSLPQAPKPTPRRALGALAGTAALITLTSALGGCVNRAVPFKDLDNAQVTVYRLQQAPAAMPTPQPSVIPGLPAIPGLTIPPEIAALGAAACQNPQFAPFLGALCQGATPMPPAAQPRLFRNTWMITAEQPIADKKMVGDMLDIFGDSGSFNSNRAPCFNPGFAVSFASPNRPEPVDVVVSYSCNQAVGFGFQWPHKDSGFTNDTRDKLSKIYQNLWGQPAPMQGG